jgi:hypothetical protein
LKRLGQEKPEGEGNRVAFKLRTEKVFQDRANLPDPDVIATEIVEDLQSALAQFAEIASDLKR